jgi:hypothetical protein
LFIKDMSRPFNERWASFCLRRWEKQTAWVLSSSILCYSAHNTTPLKWDRVAVFWKHKSLCDLYMMYHRQRARWTPGIWGVLFMYRLYRVDTMKEPCGTPESISRGVESSFSIIILNFILERNELISLTKLGQRCNLDTLYSKPGCRVVSKAFSTSKKTAAVDKLLLMFRVTWSVSLIHWSVVLWRARKPNWLAFDKFFSSAYLWIIFRILSRIIRSLLTGGLSVASSERILVPYMASVRLLLLLPSKTI